MAIKKSYEIEADEMVVRAVNALENGDVDGAKVCALIALVKQVEEVGFELNQLRLLYEEMNGVSK